MTSESQELISDLVQCSRPNSGSQKYLEPVNVTLHGNRVFADVIKLGILN